MAQVVWMHGVGQQGKQRKYALRMDPVARHNLSLLWGYRMKSSPKAPVHDKFTRKAPL